MKSLRLITAHRKTLAPVYRFSQASGVELYLVGGILRDAFLGRRPDVLDFDFTVKGDAIGFGKRLARCLGAAFVVLDEEHGACRLVKRLGIVSCTFDITDFRGTDLDEDLLLRDFTVNMLCLPLQSLFTRKGGLADALIDPATACRDIRRKTIRAVHPAVFDDDPLRILRAFSLASVLGFRIETKTRGLIRRKAKGLSRVSGERLRDELFKVLELPRASGYLSDMDTLGVLRSLFPEIERMRGLRQGPYHHLDVLRHSFETVRQLELLIQRVGVRRPIRLYLDEAMAGGRRRRALMKLGAFLHDIGKPQALRREEGKTKFHGHERIGAELTEGIACRLKLSNDERDALRRMVFWHLRPGYLADNEEITARAKYRYFRDTGREALSVLLLSIADQRSTRGPLTSPRSRLQHERVALDLIGEYLRRSKEKKTPRLLNGDDLISEFGLEPSPLIGRMLGELDELQAIGKIKTKPQALEAARRMVP